VRGRVASRMAPAPRQHYCYSIRAVLEPIRFRRQITAGRWGVVRDRFAFLKTGRIYEFRSLGPAVNWL